MEKFFAMKDKPETPKVGVGVVLRNSEGKILLLLRNGSHGSGTWSLPGGHMELGETFLDTCKREIKEETAIDIQSIGSVGLTNDIFKEEGLHYITLFFEGFYDNKMQVPINMEKDKAKDMKWFTLKEIYELKNVFSPLSQILSNLEEL